MAVLSTLSLTARADDAAHGRKLFRDVCKACHGSIDERRAGAWPRGRIIPVVALPRGPDLTGVHGRPAGTVSGFYYSNAFQKVVSELVWNDETLDVWLADSQAMIRGSYMRIKVKALARHKIVEYLRTFSRKREVHGPPYMPRKWSRLVNFERKESPAGAYAAIRRRAWGKNLHLCVRPSQM